MVNLHPNTQSAVKNVMVYFVLLLLNFTLTSGIKAGNSDKQRNKKEVRLVKTFYNELNKEDKTVLKLYDDKTYEYIHFIIKRKQPVAKRETGTYKWKNNKLVLHPRNEKKSKYHGGKFYYDEQNRLLDKKGRNTIGNERVLTLSNDERFKALYYVDSVFGIVSNDKKTANKLRDYKYLPKSEYVLHVEKVEPASNEKDLVGGVTEENAENYDYTATGVVNLNREILKKIKAVIVVGKDEFDGNKDFIKEQKEVAVFLKDLGVEVKEFYYPNSKWADITKASVDAHIFIYSGHGYTMGEPDVQGSIYINDGIIEGPQLSEGLKLHTNALVIFNHACHSAGSSADDVKDIGIQVATQRVEDYAEPFMKLNAGCYYANNYNRSVIPFITDFFNGIPVNKIYRKYANKWDKVELVKKHKTNPLYETGISSRMPTGNGYTTLYTMNSNGKVIEEKIKEHKSYDVAYVGLPNYIIKDMLK